MSARRAAAFTDRQLADAVLLDGAEWAFRELYRRHTPRAFQLALRLTGGRAVEAEDALQEAWMRAIDGLEGFRWESSFGTWLTGIALNVIRGWQRRHARQQDGRAALEHVDAPAIAAPLADRIDLERAIALLPDGYRVVLVLHDVEGFTHDEIGERLGIAPGTSKSQLFAARRAMRSLLAPGKERTNAAP